MAANLSSRLLLPVALALCFGLVLAARPPSGSGGTPQEPASGDSALETETLVHEALTRAEQEQYFALAERYLAQEAKYRALLEEERLRFGDEKSKRAGYIRAAAERLRKATGDLDRARVVRREAREESRRMQAEIEALQRAYEKAIGK